ncbi:MAG: hypothetical protein A2Z02_06540 [Chloroflexi bacterium RBG_16_48_7]|nr:MAG: hypothetical protein A2Z02_06540 [Chloroflexi bacterium RBG_16_48_7]
MDFGNFGTVSFTKQAKAAPFVDFLSQGKLMATKCKKCGNKYFPPRMDCASCRTSDMEWFEIKSKGKLLTFTQVQYGPLGFEADVPYVLGIVQFPEGVSVLSRVSKKIPFEEIKVGMELGVIPIKLSEEKFSYEFVK